MPVLDEGHMTIKALRLPSISLAESVKIEKELQKIILKFPEVEKMVSKIGRAEIAAARDRQSQTRHCCCNEGV